MIKLNQFYIYKFNSSRLDRSNYDITLTLKEAKENEELVAIGDNHVLRSIRKIIGKTVDFAELKELQKIKKKLQKNKDSSENKAKIKEINQFIDEKLFIPQYFSVVCNNKNHYKYMCNHGLTINGVNYVRIICSASNARRNTAFFIDESIYEEMNCVLKNEAKIGKMVKAKYNAYFALTASSTYTVSTPRVCVVPDFKFKMTKRVDWVAEANPDDIITEEDKELDFNAWDGSGIMTPQFAQIWANDMELSYIPSAFCLRQYFIKGMNCVMDFQRFGREHGVFYIKDLWGKEHHIDDLDMILTESQFKLWSCYDSWEEYTKACEKNDAKWGVSRATPEKDKSYALTNYQFLQVLDLNEEQIASLCKPTVDWLQNVLTFSEQFTTLYLTGSLCEKDIKDSDVFDAIPENYVKALLLQPKLIEDPYIKNRIVQSINKRIKEAYLGKLLVHGNFQTIIIDPYAFMEYIFGLPVKGLLNEFEHYGQYWVNKGIDTVSAMRAPLTWRSENNILHIKNNEKMEEWYKYLTSGIVYNIWGCDMMIHADADSDFDQVFTTDTPEFIDGCFGGNAVTYDKHSAPKEEIKENQLYLSDLQSFDTKIGYITNNSTTLYAMLALYEKDSLEYNEIIKRLKICRKAQGDEIDRAKGIKTKDFPKHWSTWQSVKGDDDEETIARKLFWNKLIIDKRPYFMIYLYSKYKNEYKNFMEQYEYYCTTKYNDTVQNILAKEDKTQDEKDFCERYQRFNPFLDSKCVMNLICHHMENQIGEIKSVKKATDSYYYLMTPVIVDSNLKLTFDHRKLLKMKDLFTKYKQWKSNKFDLSLLVHLDGEHKKAPNEIKDNQFYKMLLNEAYSISSNLSELTNLAIYICYVEYPKGNKDFVWDVFSEGIVENLITNGYSTIKLPIIDANGDIKYLWQSYSTKEINIVDNFQ